MNFAAQFFYSNYLVDGSSSKAVGFSDAEECDPFWQSEEERLGVTEGVHGNAACPAARRPTLIEPERLKDFGEEELLSGDETKEEEELPKRDVKPWGETSVDLLNGDVKTSSRETNGEVKTRETKVAETPGTAFLDLPKTHKRRGSVRRGSVRKASVAEPKPEPTPEYLRFEDISAAAFKIQSGILKTPCTYSRLSKQYGMEIYLKKEHLQYTGSVKERGALNLLTNLTLEQQKKGVIVATDCNFTLAVAHHAVELNIPVLVIMPASCPPPRLRTYRDYGAMVICYGNAAADSLRHARHLAEENGYLCLEEDDSAVYLAGLGTVGMEIHEQVSKLDAVIVPAGGQCGLLVGTAAAIKHLNSCIMVIGVEPEGFPLLLQSIKIGSPVKDMYNATNKKLYGDTVEHTLSTHTFELAKKLVDKVVSVREEDSLVAMLRFQEFERSTVDSQGAAGLAAILSGQLPELKGKKVAVVVSSANMELDLVRQCVDRALVLDERVSRFTLQLGDVPADMARLLDTLAREDVRLLDVCRRRQSDRADLFKAQVECAVETRDKTQSAQLRRTLLERYPTLCWLDQ